MDGKQKRITLTVPYTEDPLARADGALWDGRDRTGAAKDGRSIAVLHVDIGKALLASWPGEPASDYAKRLAEIEAEVARRAKPLPFYYGKVTAVLHEDRRDDLGWLLGQLRATSDALREAQAELARRADPNGTWAKLEALAGKVAGIADEIDMSDDFTPDPRPFAGSKEATIAKLAEVDPALAADVARANGYEGDWEERAMNTLDLGDLEAADKARDAARVVYCTRCCKDHAVMPDETPCPDGTWIAKVIG